MMFDRHNGGADLMRVNFEQIGADVIAAGLHHAEQLDADLARLETRISRCRRPSCGAWPGGNRAR